MDWLFDLWDRIYRWFSPPTTGRIGPIPPTVRECILRDIQYLAKVEYGERLELLDDGYRVTSSDGRIEMTVTLHAIKDVDCDHGNCTRSGDQPIIGDL